MMRNRHESSAEEADTYQTVDYSVWSDPITPEMARIVSGGQVVDPSRRGYDGLKARLCFVTQASSKVCWTPTLRWKAVSPSRAALEVLEVYWGTSPDQTVALLKQEFGMTGDEPWGPR